MSIVESAAIFLCYVIATLALAVLVLVGYALSWLYARRGWPAEPTRGNCWSYAVPLWLRAGPETSGLLVTKSEHAPVPHVRFVPQVAGVEAMEFVPRAPRRGLRGVMASFWFDGEVRKGRAP